MARIQRFVLGVGLAAHALTAAADPPEHRNWGRWGADDEKGAANYITPQRIVASAGLIQKGKVFALGIGIDGKGPIYPTRMRPTLTTWVSGADYAVGGIEGDFKFADDYLFMPLQGATQWDGLSHAWYGETLYNGVPQSEVGSAATGGARRLGIENVKDSMVGRGVLVDTLR